MLNEPQQILLGAAVRQSQGRSQMQNLDHTSPSGLSDVFLTSVARANCFSIRLREHPSRSGWPLSALPSPSMPRPKLRAFWPTQQYRYHRRSVLPICCVPKSVTLRDWQRLDPTCDIQKLPDQTWNATFERLWPGCISRLPQLPALPAVCVRPRRSSGEPSP
jgi:hypothetical protein